MRHRILFTGANGRLGRVLHYHSDAFVDVGLKPLFQSRRLELGPEWVQWDGQDPTGLRDALNGIDIVVNLIGRTPKPDDATNTNLTAEMEEVNHGLALRIADIAEAAGVKTFFALSSSSIYGSAVPPLDESQDGIPLAEYGESKKAMEHELECRTGPMTCVSLRLGNLAGCDMLLGNALKASKTNQLKLDQFPSGFGPLRSYIGPRDFAYLIAQLARKAKDGVFLPPRLNICSSTPVRMDALLKAWNASVPDPIEWEYRKATEAATEMVALDAALLDRVAPETTRVSEVKEMVAQVLEIFPPKRFLS
ncbi:NAD(P)-dependent oxidoreductase [Octadecabacter sp. G9-8]|uniref:NAD(P)-dependent oxidoreductase n=1 Tax=Octadecabacter dasysiphoniae TaxID=2909341 RepID=A0ABS9CTB8_9RHOB|nr:NAD(P)-dependent oxidoreductase [Octadecabacter dasysiphoniae]MCF2869461.1 NAD(P)-dependent oxidoreductase [Octadecabacter dasysiphoniae]